MSPKNSSRGFANHYANLLRQIRVRRFHPGWLVLVLVLTFGATQFVSLVGAWASRGKPAAEKPAPSRLSESVSVRAADRNTSAVKLRDGRDVLTSYVGTAKFQQALTQNQAGSLSLATADFDEDGVPDLVRGYGDTVGFITIDRGSTDTLYQNKNKAESPFHSPARIFEVGVQPDFMGTGDFDADGHNDVVVAARGDRTLYFLQGDGHGNIGPANPLQLDGQVTAFATGEINRRDGLTDLVLAIDGTNGPQLLVFEGPEGAIKAEPEIFTLPAPANQLALGQLDNEYPIDVAISAGRFLLIIHGRDRRLTLDRERQAEVRRAEIENRSFPTAIVSIAIGDFIGNQQSSLAVLTDDGTVRVLSRNKVVVRESAIQRAATANGDRLIISEEMLKEYEEEARSQANDNNNVKPTKTFADWHSYQLSSGQWPQATKLSGVRLSGLPGDDLLLVDPANRQLHILTESRRQNKAQAIDAGSTQFNPMSLEVESAPVAVLPMLLDGDALQDLVILREGQSAPAVVFTDQTEASLSFRNQSPSSTQEKKAEPETGPVTPPMSQDDRQRPKSDQRLVSQKPRVKNEIAQRLNIQPSFGSCPSTPIAYGQTLGGTVTSSDCPYEAGWYFDDYSFSGTAGQQISAAMASTSFDTFLVLLAPDGSLLEYDDDSGGGTNSYIPTEGGFYTLPSSGTFTVRAGPLYSGSTGSYTVELRLQSPGVCPGTLVSLGQTINASLSSTDCIFNAPGHARLNSNADIYRFNATAGQRIAISMSASWDTYLYLIYPDGTQITDDDGGEGLNARIPEISGFLTLPTTGVYSIWATSFHPFTAGDYTLVLGVPPPITAVINTNDSGDGSLRQAIINANTTLAPETITFTIPGSGVRTINLLSELPTITSPTFINGGSQPGYSNVPIIELNGAGAGANAAGLKITGGGSHVRALVINRFSGSGIVLTTNGNNLITGNYIGTNSSGTSTLGNGRFAVQVDNSHDNTIGGTTAAARNIISGSTTSGIRLYLAAGTWVLGNYIGTDTSGNVDLGNGGNGVFIHVGIDNLVFGNLISGNNSPGVGLSYTGPIGNLVQGNFIGTNAAGTAALPNSQGGVIIGGFGSGGDCPGCPLTATDNTVGGTSPALRNIISGNNGNGVEVINVGSQHNQVQGNYIGTNVAGTAAVRNTASGVFITRAPNNTIGGITAAAGNVISGNAGHGIGVGIPKFDPVSGQTIDGGTGVRIQSNLIGTVANGISALGNLLSGIYLDAATTVNIIEGNVIAFNGGNGITIPANSAFEITITLNRIFANSGMAIDLGNPGDTPNDDLDIDGGANKLQNYPELQTAFRSALTVGGKGEESLVSSSITVNYRLRSSRNSTFKVEFFASNGNCLNKEFTERGEFIGSEVVPTDPNGTINKSITLTLPATMAAPQWVLASATATDVPAATIGASPGNTSEFSSCMAVIVASTQTLTVASTNPSSGVSITVSPNDNGAQGNGTTQFARTYNTNTVVSLTAPATASGNNFQKWQRNGVDFAVTPATTVTMDANHTMTAVYSTQPRTLTVASTNPSSGVSIFCNPFDNDAQSNGTTQFTRIYNNNTVVNLTAPPTASGNNFQKWQRNGVDFAVTLATSVTMDANHTMTAVYVAPPRTLTVASTNPASGVNITVSPNDNGALGNGATQFTRTYNNNTVVSLTAPATASGNNFQKWQRDGVDFAVTLATTVTMDANHTMTAVYVAPPRTLTVASTNPASGVNITVSPNDNGALGNGATQFTRTYNNNTVVSLTAPATASGNNFQKWQRDGVDFAVTLATTVTMDANHTMTAVYVAPPRTLTVASTNPASGVNITVSPNDNGALGNGATQFTRTYNNNTVVSLTAPATASGNNFQKWQRDGVDFAVTLATTVTMDANHTMTAVYVAPPRTLTVASTNPASGVNITVSPNDNGALGNGATQFTRTYNNNTVVSLTAPATASGNNFQKWQRDGVDFAVTLATTVTMDANHTMTAVYVAPPRTLTVASTNPASGVNITVSPNDNGALGNGATQFTRTYNNNTVVSLTAPATASGNNFQKWQRDGVDFAVTLATTVTMDANHTMTAVYATPNSVQLSSGNLTVSEGAGSALIIVTRTPTAGAATVDYATSDNAGLSECNVFNGTASSRCDIATSIGTLRFAAGEGSKNIFIPIVDDSYAEGNEAFTLTLSNPTGMTLGSIIIASITIQDNETVNGINPVDGVDFFIRQNYIDFLGREPDPAGLAGWRNVLVNCGTTIAPPCDRTEVSAGFFRSEEFQSRGYFSYRFYSSVGRIPLSNEFFPDFAKVSGFLTVDQLEANKVAFVNEFMARAEFQTKYSSTFSNPTAYVDALLLTVGLPTHSGRAGWIATLNANNNSQTRALVLRQLVESSEVYNKYFNEAFVIMQYFGYLRRTADASYLSWIQTMNQNGGDYRTMINGFLNSAEYRRRFGP
ncbi:MAG: InlB B-repeat-containing protein [Acidobacteriota bacterium]